LAEKDEFDEILSLSLFSLKLP